MRRFNTIWAHCGAVVDSHSLPTRVELVSREEDEAKFVEITQFPPLYTHVHTRTRSETRSDAFELRASVHESTQVIAKIPVEETVEDGVGDGGDVIRVENDDVVVGYQTVGD